MRNSGYLRIDSCCSRSHNLESVLDNNNLWRSDGVYCDTMAKKEINKEKTLLTILSSAFDIALKGFEAEKEALKLFESLGEEDMSAKLKILEAKEHFFNAQTLIKKKAEVEFNDLLSINGDFDMLRNQVNTLCIDLFSMPGHEKSVIKVKESAKTKGLELIEKLEKKC